MGDFFLETILGDQKRVSLTDKGMLLVILHLVQLIEDLICFYEKVFTYGAI